MEKIQEFRINLEEDSLKNVYKIKGNIDEFSEQTKIIELCNDLSTLLKLPNETVKIKLKQILYGKFDYFDVQPKFKIKLNLIESIKYIIYFVILIIFQNKTKNKNKKVDLILDNVEKEYVIKKFEKILSSFNKPLILLKSSFVKKESYNKNYIFLNEHMDLLSNNILRGKRFQALIFLKKLIFFSYKNNINFLKIFFTIFYTSLKYYKIFNAYESKVLIHDRVYHTCPIRNYLFKKYGGKKILCLQSHLAEGTTSVFCDIDTLVTFGKEKDTEKKLISLGGKINKSIQCGSLRMEQELKFKDKINKIDPIDILIIGINPAIWRGTSKTIIEIYYEQIKWIAAISNEFPEFNLIYKHHANFKGDSFEKKILENANIKTIVQTKNMTNSYHYLLKSKLILSFASTMILEGLSLGKKCFFLDPQRKNSTFFGGLNYLNELRISSYEDLKKKINENLIINKTNNKIDNDIFCLTHESVSNKICKLILDTNNNL